MKDTRLYELSAAVRAIEAAMQDDDDDDPIAWRIAAAEVRGAFRDKVLGIGLLLQEWEGEAERVQAEAKRLSARAAAITNRHGRLKDYLLREMQAAGIDSVKGDLISLRVQNSPAKVDIPDDAALPSNLVDTTLVMRKNLVPEELLEHVKGEAPDRKAIKAALDEGAEVPGWSLSRGQYLTIR